MPQPNQSRPRVNGIFLNPTNHVTVSAEYSARTVWFASSVAARRLCASCCAWSFAASSASTARSISCTCGGGAATLLLVNWSCFHRAQHVLHLFRRAAGRRFWRDMTLSFTYYTDPPPLAWCTIYGTFPPARTSACFRSSSVACRPCTVLSSASASVNRRSSAARSPCHGTVTVQSQYSHSAVTV
eukprot:1184971-Prorocentrum_minimum.AAC.2